jgi:hypothetical protein
MRFRVYGRHAVFGERAEMQCRDGLVCAVLDECRMRRNFDARLQQTGPLRRVRRRHRLLERGSYLRSGSVRSVQKRSRLPQHRAEMHEQNVHAVMARARVAEPSLCRAGAFRDVRDRPR